MEIDSDHVDVRGRYKRNENQIILFTLMANSYRIHFRSSFVWTWMLIIVYVFCMWYCLLMLYPKQNNIIYSIYYLYILLVLVLLYLFRSELYAVRVRPQSIRVKWYVSVCCSLLCCTITFQISFLPMSSFCLLFHAAVNVK